MKLSDDLVDLRNKISSSSVGAGDKNAYILAIDNNEKLLNFLETIVDESDVQTVVRSILEAKTAIQDIVYQWNQASLALESNEFQVV
jgi:hypothetical protein